MMDWGTRPAILVTGAAGFIGSALCAALLARGARVRGLVRPGRENDLPAGVAPLLADLTEPASLDGVEEGIDAVIHAAGQLGKWGVDADQLRAVNVEGPLRLLERFHNRSPQSPRQRPLQRFIHLSAGGVSGPLPADRAPGDETTPCRPVTPYEQTKHQAETALLAAANRWRLPLTIIRPTFTFGPGDAHKLGLFRAIQRGRFPLIGPGGGRLHPLYIDDAVQGALLALERGGDGEVYLIGGAEPVSIQELAAAIARQLGVAPPRLRLPLWLARAGAGLSEALAKVTGRAPMLSRSRLLMVTGDYGFTIAKARKALGYDPRVSLKAGLARTIADYRARGWL